VDNKNEEEVVTALIQKARDVAAKLSINLDTKEGTDLIIKCMAISMVSLGAEVGEESFAIEGLVYGGNRERCDTYEFNFKSALKQRHLAN